MRTPNHFNANADYWVVSKISWRKRKRISYLTFSKHNSKCFCTSVYNLIRACFRYTLKYFYFYENQLPEFIPSYWAPFVFFCCFFCYLLSSKALINHISFISAELVISFQFSFSLVKCSVCQLHLPHVAGAKHHLRLRKRALPQGRVRWLRERIRFVYTDASFFLACLSTNCNTHFSQIEHCSSHSVFFHLLHHRFKVISWNQQKTVESKIKKESEIKARNRKTNLIMQRKLPLN